LTACFCNKQLATALIL